MDKLLRWISLLQLGLRWAQAISDVAPSLWRPLFVPSVPSWGSIPVSSSLGASFSLFLAPAFLLSVEEFSCLDRRASSLLMYFSALVSTSAMFV